MPADANRHLHLLYTPISHALFAAKHIERSRCCCGCWPLAVSHCASSKLELSSSRFGPTKPDPVGKLQTKSPNVSVTVIVTHREHWSSGTYMQIEPITLIKSSTSSCRISWRHRSLYIVLWLLYPKLKKKNRHWILCSPTLISHLASSCSWPQ